MEVLNEQQMDMVGGGYAYGSYRALNKAINEVVNAEQPRSEVVASVRAALEFYRTPASQRGSYGGKMALSSLLGDFVLHNANWHVG